MEPYVIAIVVAAVAIVAVLIVLAVRARRGGAPRGSAVLPAPPSGDGLRARLARSRTALATSLGALVGSAPVGDDEWADIEDALILADVGPATSATLVGAVRARRPETGPEARMMLEDELVAALDRDDRALLLTSHPAVVVVVGVNGTGKTTSIAKIAQRCRRSDLSVVLGAADTFRAAADEQLKTWGLRVDVPVVSGAAGSDPASVAFEALRVAQDSDADVVVIDTAGRLHSQVNLMDELKKVIRVLKREAGHIDEVLLVLDGSVGQNGIAQARSFMDAVGVTGVVITKLDGTSRGGCAIAIEKELDVPIKYIGIGEGMDDLIPFVPEDFVRALVAE